MNDADSPGRAKALQNDLRSLARRALHRVFVPMKSGPLKAPTLLKLLANLYPEASQGNDLEKREALADLIKTAALMLPDEPIDKAPKITWRYAALWLYELVDVGTATDFGYVGSATHRYNRVVDVLRRKADFKVGDFDDVTADVRERLALALLDLEAKRQQLDEAPEAIDETTSVGPDPTYVLRPTLQAQFDKAIESGARIVLFHGEAGTGKSTIAERVLRPYLGRGPSAHVPIVNADTDESLAASLESVLRHAGQTISGSGLTALISSFGQFLANPTFKAIVLDNIDSNARLRTLVAETTGLVVVTSRKQLEHPTIPVTMIEVPNMLAAEGEQLVARHLSDMSPADAAWVAHALDYRPLAIEHGCVCLANEPYNGDVARFCAALARQTAVVLDSYGHDEDVTLIATYKMILDQLKSQPAVLDFLELVTFVGRGSADEAMLLLIWPPSNADGPGQGVGVSLEDADWARFIKAARVARRWNLVRVVDGRYVMHALTQSLVAFHRSERELPLALRSYRCLNDRLALSAWEGGLPLPSGWPRIGPLLGWLLSVFGDGKVPGFALGQVQMDQLVAVLLRETRGAGDPTGVLLDVGRIAVFKALSVEGPSSPLDRELLESGQLVVDGPLEEVLKPWAKNAQPPATPLRSPFWLEPIPLPSIEPWRPSRSTVRLDGTAGLDDRILGLVQADRSDAYLFEAVRANDFLPLKESYDAGVLAPHIGEAIVRIRQDADRLNFARYASVIGVLHFESANWSAARQSFLLSRDIYVELATECPGFHGYAAQCTRRLLEVAIRSHDSDSVEVRLGEADRACELLRDAHEDSLLLRLLEITMKRALVEHALTGKGVDDLHFDALNYGLHNDKMYFDKRRLDLFMLQAWFDECRLVASRFPADASEDLHAIARLCRMSGFRHGRDVAALTALKIDLLAEERDVDYTPVCEFALTLADGFKGTSPFWEADSLCVALAAGLRDNAEDVDFMQTINEYAESATGVIGRPDKLQLARSVGEKQSSALLLLAE